MDTWASIIHCVYSLSKLGSRVTSKPQGCGRTVIFGLSLPAAKMLGPNSGTEPGSSMNLILETLFGVAALGTVLAVSEFSSGAAPIWLQMVLSGGFGAIAAWYLLVYRIPSMQARFDEHYAHALSAYERQAREQRETHERVVQSIVDQHEKHCDRLVELANRRMDDTGDR